MSDQTDDSIGSNVTPVGTDWVPRTPAHYKRTRHYESRVSDPDRFLNDGWAARAITNGEADAARDGTWRFALSGTGLDMWVICGLTGPLYPAIVSGYAVVRDYDKADQYGRFDRRKLKCAIVRNHLSDSVDDHDSIVEVHLSRPTRFRGHMVTTRPGSPYVECADCGEQFTNVQAVAGRNCEG